AGDPMEVAKRQGFVQAETVAQRGHRVRARVQSEHVGSRVAWNDLDHGEDDEARRYKAEGERDEPSEEIAQHAGPPPGAEARANARGGPERGRTRGTLASTRPRRRKPDPDRRRRSLPATAPWPSGRSTSPTATAFAAMTSIRGAALDAGEDGGVDLPGDLLVVGQDHAVAPAAQGLVGGGGGDMGMREGRGAKPRHDQPGEMCHAQEQRGADAVGDLVITGPWASVTARITMVSVAIGALSRRWQPSFFWIAPKSPGSRLASVSGTKPVSRCGALMVGSVG